MSVNKVILVGNVGKDPEVRHLEGGATVCNFSLATSEVYRNKSGEKVTQTEWHNIVLWRQTAEIAEKYVRKGSQIYIEGRIRTRSYDDQNGVKRYVTEIYGDTLQLLGRKQDGDNAVSGGSSNGQAIANQSYSSSVAEPDFSSLDAADDLPF
jgi:single-strand DNA-binding protein